MNNRSFSNNSASTSSHNLVPQGLTQVLQKPDLVKLQQFRALIAKGEEEVRREYKPLLEESVSGQVVYTLRVEDPKKVMEMGGFKAKEGLRHSLNSGNSTGFVCFTLLPEIAAIFASRSGFTNASDANVYIYATVLNGNFFKPWGQFCQWIVPYAFPLDNWWIARKVERIENDKVILGEATGRTEGMTMTPGERYEDFIAGVLMKPKQLSDSPAEFEIIHTRKSRLFQQEVDEHYQNALSHRFRNY